MPIAEPSKSPITHKVVVGCRNWLKDNGHVVPYFVDHHLQQFESKQSTVVLAAIDDRLVAAFVLTVSVKPEADAVVAVLKDMHLNVQMVTGDNRRTATAIANQVCVLACRLTPHYVYHCSHFYHPLNISYNYSYSFSVCTVILPKYWPQSLSCAVQTAESNFLLIEVEVHALACPSVSDATEVQT